MTILITHDIAEAISLCDVIVVMTRRPGRVRAVYDIDIEKPRNVYRVRETARFGELYRAIWKEIREEILPDRSGQE
jgi:NitT/TauT family transport system ATP-binding protein